jgi:hypothetical protein
VLVGFLAGRLEHRFSQIDTDDASLQADALGSSDQEGAPPRETGHSRRPGDQRARPLSAGPSFGGYHLQRKMVEAEGVVFMEDGRVDLERYLWVPDVASATVWARPVSQRRDSL